MAVSLSLLSTTLNDKDTSFLRFEERDTLFQKHGGKQKGKGLDVEAEPPRRAKHFLKAVTRGTKLQSDEMHLGEKQLNYLICDKRLSQGARKLEILLSPNISGGRIRCES